MLKRLRLFEVIPFFSFFIISSSLMWKTFNVENGNLLIASRAWSDFSAILPLIRSFSFGSNFPPEYPIFAGLPIRYHFVFFALVGNLEKIGIPLDWALNSLSTLSFFSLLVTIYYLGKKVFKNTKVGVLSVILFLFNGSWGFLEFFKKHPLSPDTLKLIFSNNEFTSFGPYDGKIVSAFWSLNIFTNQRHLALGYAAFLTLILLVYIFSKNPEKFTWTKALLIGIFVGLFPFIHIAIFAMMGIALLTFFLIYPKLRTKLFILGLNAILLAIPQYLYMGNGISETKLFNPGYLVQTKTFIGYLRYWFMNLGVALVLAPFGFLLANKGQRKLFLPFLVLFIVGNIFRFSPEVAANHKFFNLFVIGLNFYVALTLIKFWTTRVLGKIAVIILFIPLTLTGVIDLFPILNDTHIMIADYPNDPKVTFIVENTPKDSTFLNSQFLYHPASIAGRKIFMGWPYFPWSAGYDTHERGRLLDIMYTSNDKAFTCTLLLKNNIDYLTVQNTSHDRDFPKIDISFFEKNFKSVYRDQTSEFQIFDVSSSCQGYE